MGQVEQHAHLAAGKDPSPHHAQNKGGAGIVAEGEQPLGLGLGTHALLVEL